MKTLNVLFLICFNLTAFANNEKYIETMKQNMEIVYKSKFAEELQSAVNALNRIGDAEKNKWEPYYYASFGNIMLATREAEGTKKDAFLDQAKTALEKASAIQPNNSEIAALDGFILVIRVTVDPASRGPQYSMQSMQLFGKALAINPNNPRAMALMAQMQFGTAQFFKQSPTEACAANQKALDLFNAEKPSGVLAPVWGKGMAEGMAANCK